MQTVTLLEVIKAARMRQASLVPESAGYLMLALGRAMAGLPLRVDPATVVLGTEGVVSLTGSRERLPVDEAALAMRELLGQLLAVSQGLPGALGAALEPPTRAAHPLHAFFATVTRALIPINRGAAKRALARLARETVRAQDSCMMVDDEPAKAVAPAPRAAEVAPAPRAAEPAPADTAALPDELAIDVEVDIEVATPTPSPVIETIELATPTPSAVKKRTPSPVLAAIELRRASPEATPTVVDAPVSEALANETLANEALANEALANEERPKPAPAVATEADEAEGPDATPAAHRETHPYRFELRNHQVSVGPVSPQSIRFEQDIHLVDDDIDAAFEAMRALSPVAPVAVRTAEPMATTDDEAASLLEDDEAASLPEHDEAASTPQLADGEPAEADEPPSEIELVERLHAAACDQAVARRRARLRGPRKLTRLRAKVAEDKDTPELEQLLDGLSGERDGDAVAEAAASLKKMAYELTPIDVMAGGVSQAATPAPWSSESTPAPSVSDLTDPSAPTPTSSGLGEDDRSIPPALVSQGGASRKPIWLSAGLLLAGLCAVALVQLRPELVGGAEPPAAPGAAASPSPHCYADVDLTGLPSPHEILLRLGEAPLRTRPLPTGVRLELIATAPEHQPARLVVPADADWQTMVDRPVLRLHTDLRRGATVAWPDAPAGDVGGVGSAGVIDFEAAPAATELWLVAGAGVGERRRVTLPCEEARLTVVATDQPATQRRLMVPAELLRAAADSGPAEIAVGL